MFKTKALIILSIFLSINLYGASKEFMQSIGYETSYQSALSKAKSSNKPIMMVITTTTCPWCRKFERQTLRKRSINNTVHNNFIALSVTRGVDSYPYKFDAKVVPTVFFIDPKNEKIFDKSLGYKNKNDYIKVLEKASKKYRN